MYLDKFLFVTDLEDRTNGVERQENVTSRITAELRSVLSWRSLLLIVPKLE